jgi:hypothetical protein
VEGVEIEDSKASMIHYYRSLSQKTAEEPSPPQPAPEGASTEATRS